MADIDLTGYDNPATPGVDEGTIDVGGLIVSHPTGGVVSGTGGFRPFLRQNNNDGSTQGFNTSDANTLANAGDEGLDMDSSWTQSIKFGDLPVVYRDGIAYYEIRLDLNEENSGTDSGGDPKILLELSELQLYWSDQQATLADYTAGSGLVLDSDFHNVYDLDANGDTSLILTDGPSGSGNDDYVFYIPVSAFAAADPDDYFTLFAQFGPQPQEGATFEEFRVQNAYRITGTKYLDVNGDGTRDADGVDNVAGNADDETGLAGFTMYIDANHNNVLDLGEATALSGAGGAFAFYNLLAGTYDIREVLTGDDVSAAVKAANPDWDDYLPPSGIWDQTTGNADGDHVVTITTASQTALVGNQLLVPEIHLEKGATIDGGSANVANEVIHYTLAVSNTGDIPLTGIVITDPYADANSIAAVTVQFNGNSYNTGDTDHDNALDLTETWQYTATHTVTQTEIDNNGGGDGVLENTATVNSDQGASDTDDANVPVLQSPSLAIDKTFVKWQDDGATGNAAGDVALYTVKITNTGNVTLTNVTVVDPVTGQNISGVTLAPGASNTYNTSYTLTQADLDNNGGGDGDIDNTATADSDQTNSVNDSAAAPISAVAGIDIEKSVMTDVNGAFVDADAPDGPEASTSSEVDFKVVLTNTGNVTLTDVTISDTVVHTVGGVAGAPQDIDYTAAGAFIDLNGNGTMQAGEQWSAFDTDGDGTLDIDENGDPFELSVGESVTIYYSLTSALGQHENTAVVTTGESAGDNDDANYFVLATDDCVGVRTPGFWSNPKWMTFWDGRGDGWGTAPNEPAQAGTPGFADGELLYKVYLTDSNHDGVINGDPTDGIADDAFSTGLLIGDYNMNGITDAGEDTIFISLPDAIKLINASSKQLVEGKGTADGIYMLGRDMVATWLNYLANNQDTTGQCIGNVDGATNTPREFLDAAIDWMQQFASTTNGTGNQNLVNSYHDGNHQSLFQFDARVNPSSASWQSPVTAGEDIPVSAAAMHAALDGYNNTGAIGGVEYCCDADSEIALSAIAQII